MYDYNKESFCISSSWRATMNRYILSESSTLCSDWLYSNCGNSCNFTVGMGSLYSITHENHSPFKRAGCRNGSGVLFQSPRWFWALRILKAHIHESSVSCPHRRLLQTESAAEPWGWRMDVWSVVKTNMQKVPAESFVKVSCLWREEASKEQGKGRGVQRTAPFWNCNQLAFKLISWEMPERRRLRKMSVKGRQDWNIGLSIFVIYYVCWTLNTIPTSISV